MKRPEPDWDFLAFRTGELGRALDPDEVRVLVAAAAYFRVWVEWSPDAADKALAAIWRRGGRTVSAAAQKLVAKGLVELCGPEIFGGGRAPKLTEARVAVLRRIGVAK